MSVKSVVRSTAYNGLYKIIESVANARDPSGQFVIFSDPRGGSTWLTEIIATIPGTEILWEPLHLARVPEFAKLSFAWRQHIPEDQEWEDAYVLFNKLFSGRLLNHWICSQTTPLRLQKAENLIVKFCRANALIPWLTKQFSFHHAPVYMIRHPFSVVASQLEWGAWDDTFTGFHIPDSPHNALYKQHEAFLSGLQSKEESLLATWCITNQISLTNSRNNIDWITVTYEQLLQNPENEIERIFSRWNLPVPDKALDNLRRPSITTKNDTFTKDFERQLSKWQAYFNIDQVKKFERILDYFEVEIYTTDIFPTRNFLD